MNANPTRKEECTNHKKYRNPICQKEGIEEPQDVRLVTTAGNGFYVKPF